MNETNCKVCGKAASLPHKRVVGGVIVERCVAKIHDQHMVPHTNDSAFVHAAVKSFKKSGIKRFSGVDGF